MEIVIVFTTVLLLVHTNAEVQPQMIPFGSQFTNIKQVKEEVSITPNTFIKDYMMPEQPFILRSAAKDWPAISVWTDAFLKEDHGKLELKIDGRNKETFIDMPPQGDVCLGRDTLDHFLNTYKDVDVDKFVESELPIPLYEDIKIPPPIGCGDLSRSLVEIILLLSSGELQTMLQKHTFNTLTCVLNGTREFKLVEPTHNENMYEIWRGDTHERGTTAYSLVNAKKVDLKKFPKVGEIPEILSATLNPGDCMYFPSGYWYTVTSKDEKNLGVAFALRDAKEINFDDLEKCGDTPNPSMPSHELDPDWRYIGHGRMSRGNRPIPYYTNKMDSFFSPLDKNLKYDNMYNMLLHLHSYLPYAELHVNDRTRELYANLTGLAGNAEYTKANIVPQLDYDQLRHLINEYVQPPIPANSYDHEYSFFSPEVVPEIYYNISEQTGGYIEKWMFVESYERIGGHAGIANVTWDALSPGTEEIEYKEYASQMDIATEKFYLYWKEKDELFSDSMVESDPAEPPPSGNLEGSDDLTRDEL